MTFEFDFEYPAHRRIISGKSKGNQVAGTHQKKKKIFGFWLLIPMKGELFEGGMIHKKQLFTASRGF